ncbi:chemotaxis protein CheA [bacterium]|nr:MAG: chemotaxis protein CheA [bacterium]
MEDSYRELFISESQEYLNIIGKSLVVIEENPSDLPALNEVFRCMHTLKGMSATMGFDKLAQLSHQMEDLLDELRSQRRRMTTEIMDALFASVDILERLLEDIKLKRESTIDILVCMQDLKKLVDGKGVSREEKTPEAQEKKDISSQPQTTDLTEQEIKKVRDLKFNAFNIKIKLVKDCVMKEARAFLVLTSLRRNGEVIKTIPDEDNLKGGKFDLEFSVIFATRENRDTVMQDLAVISDLENVSVVPIETLDKTKASISAPAAPTYIKKIQNMRISVERLDKIMNLMGELTIAKIRLVQIVQSSQFDSLEEVTFSVDHLTAALQDEIIQTRLLPVAYVLDAFPRVVRDLAKKQNKDVELEIVGSEIELDRVVLDEIGDLLVHLVRNAIDHGLESSQDRKAKGKKPQGNLAIKISRQKGQIFIEVVDNGRGVDFNAVKKVALSKGLITEEETKGLDEKRVLDLIALPGFSTAKEVTDISGRGVGLDVVKSKIEALGGRLEFETELGVGSRFILTLPLTLAIIKAMLVKVENEIFAVPLMNIRETIKIEETEIRFLQSFEVIRVRDEVIPIIRLQKEMDIPLSGEIKNRFDPRLSLVIVEYGKKALGLVVSQVIGEQDIVVKPLGSFVKRTKGIAGATILGDGKVALILDTMSLK